MAIRPSSPTQRSKVACCPSHVCFMHGVWPCLYHSSPLMATTSKSIFTPPPSPPLTPIHDRLYNAMFGAGSPTSSFLPPPALSPASERLHAMLRSNSRTRILGAVGLCGLLLLYLTSSAWHSDLEPLTVTTIDWIENPRPVVADAEVLDAAIPGEANSTANKTSPSHAPEEKPLTRLGFEADDSYNIGSTDPRGFYQDLTAFIRTSFPSRLQASLLDSFAQYFPEGSTLPPALTKPPAFEDVKEIWQTSKRHVYGTGWWKNKNPDWNWNNLDDAEAAEWVTKTFGAESTMESLWISLPTIILVSLKFVIPRYRRSSPRPMCR